MSEPTAELINLPAAAPSGDQIPLFVTCPRGIEVLLAAEITTLGALTVKERNGGVSCLAEQSVAYRICLWSRLASRVLMPLKQFESPDADALYAAARAIDWPELFALESTFAIEVAGHTPQITHTQFAGLRVKDGIADCFRDKLGARPNVNTESPDIRVHLHLDPEQSTLSLDLSGDALHRRGYRLRGANAPLKENLAAAILVRAGWPQLATQGGTLLDPMCGSGTLLLEGALMAGDAAPGLDRERFGFEAWLEHRPKLWRDLRDEALARRSAGLQKLPRLMGLDLDPRALGAARDNAKRAGLTNAIEWRLGDVAQLQRPHGEPGLLVTNPPYGERLGSDGEVIKLYSLFGAALKERFSGWQAAVFTARPDLSPRLGLRSHKLYSLYNGALPCKLLLMNVPTASTQTVATDGGDDFANRLRKNLKHLSKWAKRNDVSSYRLYDADLPDYNVAIDLYQADELNVHVQEYAAPKTVDPIRAEKRLREALAGIQQILEIPSTHLHFKVRRTQKGTAQYVRLAENKQFLNVDEHGCKLRVNLEDYLDTGLFLDHRALRRRIQQEASGKRFLNLFSYTSSATAQAVVGGASQTLSVDLSNTYLDWSENNLKLNGAHTRRADKFNPLPTNLSGHWLLQADCLAWLSEQAEKSDAPKFDLILLDPPTFSNSKRMEDTLDIQRDHLDLLRPAVKLLAAGGTLYFSTNRRGFKLDAAGLPQYEITDITAQTLDEDFKRPPPAHRCWKIQARSEAASFYRRTPRNDVDESSD